MSLPLLDLADAGFWREPAPVLAVLREQGRVAQTAEGTRAILRHADVSELLLGGGFVNEGISLLERRGFRPGDALYEYRREALGALGGEQHRRLRALVGKALGPAQAEPLRAIVRRRVAALLPPLLDRDIDALETLTSQLPRQVIGEYLGVDEQERRKVDALVREGQAKAFGREVTPDIVRRANEIFAELFEFVGTQIAQRRLAPQNDMLGRLLEVEEERQVLNPREVTVLFLNLFIGAVESTASALSSGLQLLAQQPELLDQLHAQPALVPAFVEENLRLYPPNTLLANKVAARELEFCGVRFAAGETVIVPIPAPNRDPGVFGNPDRADLRRPVQRHFSFSQGAHFCLGHALARAQLQEFFTAVATAVRRVDLAERVEWLPFVAINSPRALRLRLQGR
ncbi:cytochrome P450 [Solimonas sp. K1W22B-7]|uniref:cytochrome P450 n=1 Tax=Solimonas sp. K1W22B-7 TaxID=2303331 RepID=UPI0013C4A56D|nr:cytochrome P450 [Solimonas sp. K1W22B-7]